MGEAITAMITPMRTDGRVDFDEFEQLIDFQTNRGIKKLVINGSTGEEKLLRERDKKKLLTLAGRRAMVIAGVGAVRTEDAVRNAIKAKRYGATYALLTAPEYIKPTTDGLLRHFRAVQNVIQTIVYDIKGRTGRQITDAEFKELMAMPNIVGVKAASGDIEQIGRVIEKAAWFDKFRKKRIYVWSGDDNLTTQVMNAGGDGVISVVSNLAPAEVRILCESAYIEKTNAANERIAPLIRAAFSENNPAGIKRIMFAAGMIKSDRTSDEIGQLAAANAEMCDKAALGYMEAGGR